MLNLNKFKKFPHIDDPNLLKIYDQCFEKWGVNAQLDMIVEECSELIKSCMKIKRAIGKDISLKEKDLINEGVDVYLMVGQLKFITSAYDFDIRNQWLNTLNKKVKRLNNLLDKSG